MQINLSSWKQFHVLSAFKAMRIYSKEDQKKIVVVVVAEVMNRTVNSLQPSLFRWRLSFQNNWITATRHETGKYMWSALHKACSMRSPPIRQLTVLSDRRLSHTHGYRDRLATRESPIRTTSACRRIMLSTYTRWEAYHPGLVSRNLGFLRAIAGVKNI